MIKLYGSPKSSAGRCVWTLEEIGVAYEIVNINMQAKEHKSPEFLKLNPNGKIPAMVDGDVTLFESMAINQYLAEKYKPELLGSNIKERAITSQWSFWAMTELQPPVIEIFIQKYFMPEDKRDQNLIAKNLEKLPALFSVLEKELANKKYLNGDHFTLADLNVASVAGIAHAIGYNFDGNDKVHDWVHAIAERPAFIKYMTLRKS